MWTPLALPLFPFPKQHENLKFLVFENASEN